MFVELTFTHAVKISPIQGTQLQQGQQKLGHSQGFTYYEYFDLISRLQLMTFIIICLPK